MFRQRSEEARVKLVTLDGPGVAAGAAPCLIEGIGVLRNRIVSADHQE